jgi:hypothetical protein
MDDATENSPPGIALPAMQILEHVDLNATDARAITDKIRGSMGDLMLLVARAWIGRVWLALGYESWADYIKGEFDRAPLYLPRDERKAVVALLRGQGMSQRPIADAVGVSQKTVDRDLDELSHDDSVVLPNKVIGLDNKERPAHPAKPDVPRPKPKPVEPDSDAEPLDWDTIPGNFASDRPPGNQQVKLDRAKAAIRRELERELRAEAKQYRAQCDANVAACKAKLDADLVTYKAQFDAQREVLNAMRDEERRRYQLGIEVDRAKGLITPDEYNVIRSCLHPDSRASATDEKLAAAFRLFSDSRIKILLVKETKEARKR